MKSNSSVKFKSSIGLSAFILFIFYNLFAIGLFILSYFLYIKKLTIGMGIFMFVIELVYLVPLIFDTYYSLNEEDLLVFQWPFLRTKIRYADIFEITDEIGEEVKKVKKVCIGKGTIYIGYNTYKYDKETKKKIKIKKYILLSPSDKDLFLIKIGGKFKRARDIAKKIEEEHQKQFEEHNRKKKIVDEKKQKEIEHNKPVDIVIKSKKKTDIDK